VSFALLRQQLAATPLGGRGMLTASLVCFWAFHFIVLWTSSFSVPHPAGNLDLGHDLTWLVGVSCNALALLGCALGLGRSRAVRFSALALVAGLLTAAGVGLIAARVAWEGPGFDIAFLGGNALFGIGTGLMMASYADVLRRVSPQTTFMATAAAFTLGALLCLVVTVALVPPARWTAAAALAPAAALLYRQAARDAETPVEGDDRPAPATEDLPSSGLPLKSFLGLIAVVGLTAGVMRGMNHLDMAASAADQLFIGSVLVGGVLLLALSFLADRLKPTLLLQGAVVVISAAFMALALLTSESAPVAFVIHTVGFVFFVALVWLFCTFLGQGCADGTRRFIVGLFANQAGQALGSLGYLGLVAAVGSSASALLPASLGTVYVLLLAALAFFANAGRAKRSVAAANALAVEPAVLLSSLAEGHRLTAREVEIGVLVAEGRSRAAIAEALVVSQETVKSHTKHLYQKLSVHSRDELMRLLEEEARLWADRRSIL